MNALSHADLVARVKNPPLFRDAKEEGNLITAEVGGYGVVSLLFGPQCLDFLNWKLSFETPKIGLSLLHLIC